MLPLIAIVGPTGVGKTSIGIQLALTFNGEIINADSRQIYCGMDIGTAKPTLEERDRLPYHLIDIVKPDRDFSLAEYKKLACEKIDDIHTRGKLPFLAGGTGLYVWTVLEGWQIPAVPPDLELRRRLEARAAATGAEQLYRELTRVDPAAAEKIDPRNVRRVIRALEVIEKSGRPFSLLTQRQHPDFDAFIIGLTAPRDDLYRIVDQRVDQMMERGLVAEVENLLKIGYDISLPAMSGIGYRQIAQFLKGEIKLDEAVRRIKTDTHRFIRHQYAWFHLTDKRINWFDITNASLGDIKVALANHFGIAV